MASCGCCGEQDPDKQRRREIDAEEKRIRVLAAAQARLEVERMRGVQKKPWPAAKKVAATSDNTPVLGGLRQHDWAT
eukprot:tig00000339_g24176.t1